MKLKKMIMIATLLMTFGTIAMAASGCCGFNLPCCEQKMDCCD